jgi:parallel beta-helix repeat protein
MAQNNLTNNGEGILLESSSYNNIAGSNITANNNYGIWLRSSSNNSIVKNNIMANRQYGLVFDASSNNTVYHNRFVDNAAQVLSVGSVNVWDDGYPSGGNWWSNYNGTDVYSGAFQNITGSDGIGDKPYVIDENNQDRYPLGVFRATLLGDLNLDGIVNILDAIQTATAFGSSPGQPKWDIRADLNNDNIIDIFDLIILAGNFGKTTA